MKTEKTLEFTEEQYNSVRRLLLRSRLLAWQINDLLKYIRRTYFGKKVDEELRWN